MADQIDIKQVTGRVLRGWVGEHPILGNDDLSQPVDLIYFNGEFVGTAAHQPGSPVFLNRPLSEAQQYSICAAMKRHHKSTKERRATLPINHGHTRRISFDDVRAKLRTRYRRR